MRISTDYPHFDSNFPNVSSNLLSNGTRKTGENPDGGAHPYGFGEERFAKAPHAAQKRRPAAAD